MTKIFAVIGIILLIGGAATGGWYVWNNLHITPAAGPSVSVTGITEERVDAKIATATKDLATKGDIKPTPPVDLEPFATKTLLVNSFDQERKDWAVAVERAKADSEAKAKEIVDAALGPVNATLEGFKKTPPVAAGVSARVILVEALCLEPKAYLQGGVEYLDNMKPDLFKNHLAKCMSPYTAEDPSAKDPTKKNVAGGEPANSEIPTFGQIAAQLGIQPQ